MTQDRELASLKREFQELREQQKELRSTVKNLRSERETFIDTIAKRTPVSRRQVNALVATLGITGAVSYLASEGVLAAGESWGSSTGTMGPDAEPIANSNIQDLDVQTLATESLTVDGDTGIGFPSTSSDLSPGFDSWTTPNASRPVWLFIEILAETDGTTRGLARVRVDESGGTTPDYDVISADADPAFGSGGRVQETGLVPLPAGGSFEIQNFSDPNNANTIQEVREFVL